MTREQWRVKGISGLPQKLQAARLSGCRRVFIPRENLTDVNSLEQEGLQILPVDTLIEVILQLQSQPQPVPGNSSQIRKLNALPQFLPRPRMGALIASFYPRWSTVSRCPFPSSRNGHQSLQYRCSQPKQHNLPEYQRLLAALQGLERPTIPLRKIEQKFTVKDSSLRMEIRAALE